MQLKRSFPYVSLQQGLIEHVSLPSSATRCGDDGRGDYVQWRGSSDYSEQSLSCVDYNRESPEDPIPYRPRSSSPATSEKEYSIPTPSPLSHNELSRLPLVIVEKCDLKGKACSCGKAWREGESVTQLYCSHRLHSTCAEQLLEKGVCPTCNSKNILDPKHREIKIDLSGFNF